MSSMTKSDSIAALAKALARFHSNAPAIHKNATNPHFKNQFADLGGILGAVRAPLAEVGLSVLQLVGENTLTTMLLHESGEFIESTAPLIVSKNDMQGLGSAVSYQRRYSLQGVLSLAASDDDGNSACAPAPVKAAPAKDWAKEVAGLMKTDKVSESDIFAFLKSKDAKVEASDLKTLPVPFLKGIASKWEEVVAFSFADIKEAA
jgi:hypothetical protein